MSEILRIVLWTLGIPVALFIGFLIYREYLSEGKRDFLRQFAPCAGIFGAILIIGYLIYGVIAR